ncbi:hypothetical protein A6S26_17730 [Nostoc sp. ATCC 43529]|nr:hypothetical protein A6S26_17730 [Nostoc sp. ATCC 43529]
MTEALAGCAKHANVKAEALTGKAEALTGKAEALTGCAKHGNLKAEALTGKAEALTVAISCCNTFLRELPNKINRDVALQRLYMWIDTFFNSN